MHAREIEAARKVAPALGVARHLELDVPLSKIGGSALVGDGDIPKDRSARRAGIPSTYVPARNTVFLSLAMAWAEVVGAEAIVIGVNALDYSGYPDCRPEYLAAPSSGSPRLRRRPASKGGRCASSRRCSQLSKADIIRRGLALGVDYGLTLSCYDPGAGGRPCGHCDSCLLRAQGFSEAGIADPVGSGAARD